MAYSKTPALLGSKKEYVRHFGGFRGVDFSSEHTDVLENRFAYAVNVYKDYQSGQGTAVETIPGFRRRFVFPDDKGIIYGIHKTPFSSDELVHVGKSLYKVWLDDSKYAKLSEGQGVYNLVEGTSAMVYTVTAEGIPANELKDKTITIQGQTVTISTYSGKPAIYLPFEDAYKGLNETSYPLETKEAINLSTEIELNERKSLYFVINNLVYIIDGKTFLMYNGTKLQKVSELAYVPTTYAQTTPELEEKGKSEAYEQYNVIGESAKNVFYVSFEEGETEVTIYPRSQGTKVAITSPGGTDLTVKTDYTFTLNEDGNTVKSVTIKKAGENTKYLINGLYTFTISGIKSSFKAYKGIDAINGCTVGAIYDGRLFLSGNPNLPNHVFWCGINQETNLPDPTYWGEYDYVQDGVGNTPVKGMITVADSLMVLKGETQGEGSIYYHSPYMTGNDLAPITYPPIQGLYGTGCLGACINFLDDPVFLSRLGLEGIGTLSVRLERAVEHRSTLVDIKLTSMPNLESADMIVWNGYLCILVDGKIFMADSRQRYTDSNGIMQYEWYYLENIGVWDEDIFSPACSLANIDENLFFGTTNGVICSFNFDKRDENGELSSIWYSFDGKAIYSAVATKMDNCGIPHLTKSTVKKSVVIKTRTMVRSAAKIRVRTNKDGYTHLAKIVSSRFDFENLDFEELSFSTESTTIFAITEKTKRWMEKQYVIYSDELHKPLSINYIAYRYTVAGRYKE